MDIEENKKVQYIHLTENNQNMVVESLCTNCMKKGTTTVLLTDIPFFKGIPSHLKSCFTLFRGRSSGL